MIKKYLRYMIKSNILLSNKPISKGLYNMSREIVFKTKKYEYKIIGMEIMVSKKGKFVTKSKISKFRILHNKKPDKHNNAGNLIFITDTMNHSVIDQYYDEESALNIKNLVDAISPYCILDFKSHWAAGVYTHPKEKKPQPEKTKKTTGGIVDLIDDFYTHNIVKSSPSLKTPDTTPPKKEKTESSLWKKLNATQKTETKCTCTACAHVWYVSKEAQEKSEANRLMGIGHLLSGNTLAVGYHANNIKNLFDCPQCGSSRITKELVTFWVDKDGNFLSD